MQRNRVSKGCGHSFLKLVYSFSTTYAIDPTGTFLRGIKELDALETIKTMLNNVTPTVFFPVVTVFLLACFFVYYAKSSRFPTGTTEWITGDTEKKRLTFITARHPMEKRDIAPLAIIVAVFAFLAFFQLGDTFAPQTFFQFTRESKQILIELDEPEEIGAIMFYTGLWTGSYSLEFSEDGKHWTAQTTEDEENGDDSPTPAMDQPHSHLFKWRYATLNDENPEVKFIRITASRTPIELGELALYDAGYSLIPLSRITCADAPELFDEQELIPDGPTHMNGMYFDEIYHGRTALEHLRGIYPYETTHPPLGKEIIAVSVSVFGMTPFGWRFIGALFGVAMLIVMYIFLKNMFGKTVIAACGTLLFAFDFMRFVQTRIATIDTYGVFFILLSYFFMYRYITTDADAPFKKSLPPLALSGIFFGIGCASKWIVAYAGIGLAAIYIIRLVQLSMIYKENDRTGFGLYLTKTLLFSVLFFGVVPVVVYCLSYIPYGLARDMTVSGGMLWNKEFYTIIWDNQTSMFSYHSKLTEGHPYSATPLQWLLDARPILYVNNSRGNLRASFAAFGNPVVWWGGFMAIVAMAVRAVIKRDGKSLFIVIGYLSQFAPWLIITRVVFIYHYFPSTLFLVLALAHVLNTILEAERGRFKMAVYGFTAATGAVFVMFYPALSGIYTPRWYFSSFLKWIPGTWPL